MRFSDNADGHISAQGPDQRETATTAGAAEAGRGENPLSGPEPSLSGPPERPAESLFNLFRFDKIHDREGLSGHWPGDPL